MQNLVFVRFFPKEGAFDQVKAILETMVENTRTEPGCLVYDLYEVKDPEGNGGVLGLVEQYRDDAALLAHREYQYYKDYRATIMDHLRAPIEVNLLNPIDVR